MLAANTGRIQFRLTQYPADAGGMVDCLLQWVPARWASLSHFCSPTAPIILGGLSGGHKVSETTCGPFSSRRQPGGLEDFE